MAIGPETASDAGFPACAGIDLPFYCPPGLFCWLPRMRGDRPFPIDSNILRAQASPHARGSTLIGNADGHCALGFPACAGIDRCPPRRRHSGSWLPRMRGDRPCRIPQHEAQAVASPHARGSTSSDSAVPAPPAGFPACAGIDLMRSHVQRHIVGLPRMRGDRPAHIKIPDLHRAASPHARGSTSS